MMHIYDDIQLQINESIESEASEGWLIGLAWQSYAQNNELLYRFKTMIIS